MAVTFTPETGWEEGMANENDGGTRRTLLLGVKRAVLVPLKVFSLKRSTAGAFAIPFTILSRKNMTGDNELF